MAITIVGTPAYADLGAFGPDNQTLSVTVPAGADLLLFSEVINNDNWGQLTGVTVNGSSAGIVQFGTTPSGAANRSARVWGIISPTAGTYNIVWSFTTSSNNGGGVLAMCFTGTDLTTPVSASNVSSTGGGSSPLTTTITTPSGGIAFAAIYADNQPTPDASQTTVGTNQSGHAFSYKLNATGMTATFTGTPQVAQLVVALNPASSPPAAAISWSEGPETYAAIGYIGTLGVTAVASWVEGPETYALVGNITPSKLISLPCANNTNGAVLANVSGLTVTVLKLSDMSFVKTFTGQSADSLGVITISDALFITGTQYVMTVKDSTGGIGAEKYSAA
jgi:hypothetical protein